MTTKEFFDEVKLFLKEVDCEILIHWIFGCVMLFMLLFFPMSCCIVYKISNNGLQSKAIESGYEQKVEDNKVVWTNKSGRSI